MKGVEGLDLEIGEGEQALYSEMDNEHDATALEYVDRE